jgi:hypothetical protein
LDVFVTVYRSDYQKNDFPLPTARGEDAKGNGAIVSSACDVQSMKIHSLSFSLSTCNRLWCSALISAFHFQPPRCQQYQQYQQYQQHKHTVCRPTYTRHVRTFLLPVSAVLLLSRTYFFPSRTKREDSVRTAQ